MGTYVNGRGDMEIYAVTYPCLVDGHGKILCPFTYFMSSNSMSIHIFYVHSHISMSPRPFTYARDGGM